MVKKAIFGTCLVLGFILVSSAMAQTGQDVTSAASVEAVPEKHKPKKQSQSGSNIAVWIAIGVALFAATQSNKTRDSKPDNRKERD